MPSIPHPLLQALGYTFADERLLQQALTHPSYAHEQPTLGPCYQRLEFVGDAVLGLLVGSALHAGQPQASEGELSRQRAALVRRESLARLGETLELGRYLRVGHSQRGAAARQQVRLLADGYEALVGAVFLDGGYGAAQRVFLPHFVAAMATAGLPQDYKTMLQEACHRRGLPRPTYRVLKVEGPDHDRRYVCAVEVDAQHGGRGKAPSKRAAEQLGAQHVLRAVEAIQMEENVDA